MAENTDINVLQSIIGSGPGGKVVEFYNYAKLLSLPSMSSETSSDGSVDTFWEYFDDGVEIIWTDEVLVQVCIHTRPGDEFNAYRFRLFDDIPNEASREQIRAKYGQPHASGQAIERPFWQYFQDDLLLNFEFDEDDRMAFLTVGYPVN